MATLNALEKAELRQAMVATMPVINYSKAQMDAALQAVEDWFESNKPALVTAINAATTPLVLTNAQKKVLSRYWLLQKFNREA